MNQQLFDYAYKQYKLKDYQTALITFTQCLQDPTLPLAPSEMGLLYHQIGNCLIKLHNPSEAIQAYTQSAADPAYDSRGVVECNLGMAYANLRDYEHAIRYFERAIDNEENEAPYKAFMGLGNALMKMGNTAEAGVAFREAALDEANPDPTKALLNLGVCFMALHRPLDAVSSYESALAFDMKQETRNKLYASLGQAYVASGEMQKAVDAFENAIADKTYFLSDSASVDYQQAVNALSSKKVAPGSEQTAVLPVADMSGLDVAGAGMAVYGNAPGDPLLAQDQGSLEAQYSDANFPGYIGAYEDGGAHFFNASDEELEQWSKGLARQDRKRRNVALKVVVTFIIVILLAAAFGVGAYLQGYGFPTQNMVVEELFADPNKAVSESFSSAISDESARKMVAPVVQDDEVTINGIDRTMGESTVIATAVTPEGGSVMYRISMVRDMIGWKISNIELYFPSQND